MDETGFRRQHSIASLFGRDRFGFLLALLVLAFLLPGESGTEWPQLLGSLVNLAALAAGLAATGLLDNRRVMAAVGSVGVAGTALVSAQPQTSSWASLGALCQTAVLLVILAAVVRRVLAHDRVSLPTILGAITAYFLIGLGFAWIYLSLDGLVNGPILDPEVEGLPSYYSFVVLTTLGFGDITPVSELAQRISAIQALTGQIFLATLVARLVSLYGQPRAAGQSAD